MNCLNLLQVVVLVTVGLWIVGLNLEEDEVLLCVRSLISVCEFYPLHCTILIVRLMITGDLYVSMVGQRNKKVLNMIIVEEYYSYVS